MWRIKWVDYDLFSDRTFKTREQADAYGAFIGLTYEVVYVEVVW